MQRDRGLAGARPALHDQRTGQVAADDPVLLGLDGRDDVAHPAGAVRADGREQGPLAGQRAALVVVERVEVERLVLDPDDAAAAGGQVPAAYDATRRGRGRLVERRATPGPASRPAAGSARRPTGRCARCSGGSRRAGRPGRRPAGPRRPRAGPAASRAGSRTSRAPSGSGGCRRGRRGGPLPARPRSGPAGCPAGGTGCRRTPARARPRRSWTANPLSAWPSILPHRGGPCARDP